MRVLVCGSRFYTDRDHMWSELNRLDAERGPFTVLIHGGAAGADTLAMQWAHMTGLSGRDIAPLAFFAEWPKYGRAAGSIRNQRMIDEGKPDLGISFPGGQGTRDMVRKLLIARIEVIEIAGRPISDFVRDNYRNPI
jgi:hypothetical protein